jgi:hypothetical protein
MAWQTETKAGQELYAQAGGQMGRKMDNIYPLTVGMRLGFLRPV